MTVLRLHGLDWLAGFIFLLLFCFFVAVLFEMGIGVRKERKRGEEGAIGRDFYSYLAVTGSTIEICFLQEGSGAERRGGANERLGLIFGSLLASYLNTYVIA